MEGPLQATAQASGSTGPAGSWLPRPTGSLPPAPAGPQLPGPVEPLLRRPVEPLPSGPAAPWPLCREEPLPPGTQVEVHKLRRDGSLRIHYPGERVRAEPQLWVLRTRWVGTTWQGPYATMHPGEPCLEYYVPQGRAVILQLMDAAGRLKGFYVDLAAPVGVSLSPPTIRYRDLVLDLFVTPDGAVRLLDVDEFLQWVRAGAPPDEVAHVVGGLQEFLERWQAAEVPFDGFARPEETRKKAPPRAG